MESSVTVVVPYFNEAQSIKYTLESIAKQSVTAKRAIFVNSSSSDNTFDLVNEWIKKNQQFFSTKFDNLFESTCNPGSSKNIGIKHTETEWIAFMDCGQKIGSDWLKKQLEFIKRNDVDVAFGVVFMHGINWIDRCAVAQTYGYKVSRPCVPSTLVKKSVFDKTGLFLEGRRSGYDMAWIAKVKTIGINFSVNKQATIMYIGANYSSKLIPLFKKSVMYARPALGLDGYFSPYYYMVLALLFFGVASISNSVAIFLVLVYWLARTVVAPYMKSQSFMFYREHPIESILGLGVVGFIIDLGKLCGYAFGIMDYLKSTAKTIK